MRIPQTPTPSHGDTPRLVTAQATAYSTFECDEDIAIGWECANPCLQIEAWNEEAAGETPLAAY
jgi:hypothetical protein